MCGAPCETSQTRERKDEQMKTKGIMAALAAGPRSTSSNAARSTAIWTIPKRHHARRGDPAPSGRATTCPRWRCHSAAFPGVAATAPGSSGTVLPAPCPGYLRHPYPARTRCPTWLIIPLVALGTFSRRSSKKTFMWLKNPPAVAQKSPVHGS